MIARTIGSCVSEGGSREGREGREMEWEGKVATTKDLKDGN